MRNKNSFLYILYIDWTVILANIDGDVCSKFWNYIGFKAIIDTLNLANYII